MLIVEYEADEGALSVVSLNSDHNVVPLEIDSHTSSETLFLHLPFGDETWFSSLASPLDPSNMSELSIVSFSTPMRAPISAPGLLNTYSEGTIEPGNISGYLADDEGISGEAFSGDEIDNGTAYHGPGTTHPDDASMNSAIGEADSDEPDNVLEHTKMPLNNAAVVDTQVPQSDDDNDKAEQYITSVAVLQEMLVRAGTRGNSHLDWDVVSDHELYYRSSPASWLSLQEDAPLENKRILCGWGCGTTRLTSDKLVSLFKCG
jgi:hypothetical protein